MRRTLRITVNGRSRDVAVDPDLPLLWVLRGEVGLTGTKYGCGAGLCGSCTVHVDGEAVRSCITPVSSAVGRAVTTIEGLSSQGLHPLQMAFLVEQVPQCGWCMSGQLMTASALLDRAPRPTEAEIVEALSGNLCRCGAYSRIKRAVARAAAHMADDARF